MSSHVIEDMSSSILDFQANMVRVAYRKKTTPVDPDADAKHYNSLRYIWVTSKLDDGRDADGSLLMWRKLGFDTEDPAAQFADVGVLGLECLVSQVPLVLWYGFKLFVH